MKMFEDLLIEGDVHPLQSHQDPSPYCGFMLVFHVHPHTESTNKTTLGDVDMQHAKDTKGSKSTTTGTHARFLNAVALLCSYLCYKF